MQSAPPQTKADAAAFPRWLAYLGALASGTLVWFFSNEWICSAIAATFITAIALEWTAILTRTYPGRSWLVTRRSCYVWALLVASGVSQPFRANPSQLFERVFGMRPPEGVKDLEAERHYAGGPGDQIILIQFTADRATIDKLVAARGFKEDKDAIELYSDDERNPARLWDRLFTGVILLSGPKWKHAPMISEPFVYKWDDVPDDAHRITMLWDAKSGRAYVMWTLG
jgi:hypothetical protein